jgi:hypothetical protein
MGLSSGKVIVLCLIAQFSLSKKFKTENKTKIKTKTKQKKNCKKIKNKNIPPSPQKKQNPKQITSGKYLIASLT